MTLAVETDFLIKLIAVQNQQFLTVFSGMDIFAMNLDITKCHTIITLR